MSLSYDPDENPDCPECETDVFVESWSGGDGHICRFCERQFNSSSRRTATDGGVASVVPEGVTLDTLRERAQQPSSTPPEERKRCPNPDCRSADVVAVQGHHMAPNDPDHDYRCGQCNHKFDDPEVGGR